MIIKVTQSIFRDAFQSVRPDQFTYDGLTALFEYLDSEDAVDSEFELDVIAICCDFCQYDSMEEACAAYDLADQEELESNTVVIECKDGTVIIQNF